MKCLKCLNTTEKVANVNYNDMLKHLEDWTVCNNCDGTGKYAKEYYQKNKKHYRTLHKKYKAKLTDSYVANALVDRTDLKAKDMPKVLVQGKRQVMTINRILKKEAKHA